jgi:hypothetical protein
MPSSYKETKNIPVAISLLHEQEYHNIYIMIKSIKSKKRRAFSEKNSDKVESLYNTLHIKPIIDLRRQSLKN